MNTCSQKNLRLSRPILLARWGAFAFFMMILFFTAPCLAQQVQGTTIVKLANPYIGDWHIGCKVDAISDSRACFMFSGNLTIFVLAKELKVVMVGNTENHYPQSKSYLRIDDQKAFQTSEKNGAFSFAQSAEIIRKLSSAKKVLTRYIDWPHESNIDSDIEIKGFDDALKEISEAMKNPKSWPW